VKIPFYLTAPVCAWLIFCLLITSCASTAASSAPTKVPVSTSASTSSTPSSAPTTAAAVPSVTLSASTKPSPSPSSSVLASKLPILHAGSLAAPFGEITKEFKSLNSGVDVAMTGGGSAAIVRQITDQGVPCGVLGSADYKLIPQIMIPKFTDWYIIFASNQIVLCYTEKSKFQDQINVSNWYDILQKDGVTFGRTDPDLDPAGYRSLMVWQLAEKYYKVVGLNDKLSRATGNKMKTTANELVAALKSGDLDYAFEYDSVAKQNKLKFVTLPGEINLSSKKFEDYYKQASVQIKGTRPGEFLTMTGEPILYAVTVLNNFADQKLAFSWVQLLLSDRGVALMEATGQSSIRPPQASDISKIPEPLKNLVK
jgi:molybdate/tungstate transport system substrate-binding protein